MDRVIGLEERRRHLVRRIVVVLVALGAGAFLIAASVEWLRPSLDRRNLQTARVTRGVIESTIDANGAIVPLAEEVISSPVEARVLRVDRRAGDRVRVGDPLLTLDTATAAVDTARLSDRLAQQENGHAELRLRLDDAIATLRAQLERKLLDAEIDRYTAEQKAKLSEAGLVAASETLAAEAAAKKSRIEIAQLRDAIERAVRSRDAQLAASSAATAMARRDLEESRRQLDLAMLRAGREGVITSILDEVGATVRRGDVIARIADLSAYRVDGSISDVHAARLAPGQKAYVFLDGLTLGGTIASVDPRIVNGVVRFHVRLDEPSHKALRNNLRVEIAIVTGRHDDALIVRRGALGRTSAADAFVVRGSEAARVPVRFGLTGRESIEILSGAREGDELVVSDMTEYEDMKTIRLK